MLHQILNQQFKEGKRAEIAAILAIKKKEERKIAERDFCRRFFAQVYHQRNATLRYCRYD